MDKQIVYYTDNLVDQKIANVVRYCLRQTGLPIVYVSLGEPIGFSTNLTIYRERGVLTMFRQIYYGLMKCELDIVFLAEHDILYHPSHFEFTPPDDGKIYYNTNVWQLRSLDGHAVFYTAKRVSQLCGYREVLLKHYRKRVETVEKDGFSMKMGYEPGTHHRKERVDNLESGEWFSRWPNIDIKHGRNLSPARWSPSEFRSQRNCRNWAEADEIPPWGHSGGRFDAFIQDVYHSTGEKENGLS